MWSWCVQIVIFYVVGIFLGQQTDSGSAVIFITALFLCALITSFVKRRFCFFKPFIISFLALGIISYSYAINEQNTKLFDLGEKYVNIVGKVIDLPEYSDDNNAYTIIARRVGYLGKIYEVDDKIRLTTNEILSFGDSVEIEGFLKTFQRPRNEGSFDISRYYKSKGIYYSIHADDVKISEYDFKEIDVFYFMTYLKSKISERINQYFEGDASAIMHASLIGYKNFFSEEAEEVLYESDFMRLFYPAFVHLGILMAICAFLAKCIGRKRADVLLLVLVFGYAVFNFNIPHAVKTAGVLFSNTLSRMKKGYYNGTESVAIVSGVMLFKNPLLLFHRGFLLSVVCNIILIKFSPIVYQKLKIKNTKIKRLVTLWLLLWVSILPLQSYMFSKTTPYSLITSFFMLPVMSTFCIVSPIQLIFADVFVIKFFEKALCLFYILPNIITNLPFSKIPLSRPGEIMIIVFYLAMAIVWFSHYRRKRFSCIVLKIALVGFLIAESVNVFSDIGKLSIDFVNVSHGDGIVISTKYNDTIIIDGGGTTEFSDYNYGKEEFLPFLIRNNFYEIDLAIVSHYHDDHALGTIEAMENLKVKSVLMPDCMKDNPNRQRIEELSKMKGTQIIYAKEGMEFEFSMGLKLKVISVRNNTDFENNTSLGIKVIYGEFSALFTGDASSWIEKKKSGEWGKCSVLKVAHHGSETSSCRSFLEETSPALAIISVDEKAGYELPNQKTLKRIDEIGADVLRTDTNGNIKILAKRDGNFSAQAFYYE